MNDVLIGLIAFSAGWTGAGVLLAYTADVKVDASDAFFAALMFTLTFVNMFVGDPK